MFSFREKPKKSRVSDFKSGTALSSIGHYIWREKGWMAAHMATGLGVSFAAAALGGGVALLGTGVVVGSVVNNLIRVVKEQKQNSTNIPDSWESKSFAGRILSVEFAKRVAVGIAFSGAMCGVTHNMDFIKESAKTVSQTLGLEELYKNSWAQALEEKAKGVLSQTFKSATSAVTASKPWQMLRSFSAAPSVEEKMVRASGSLANAVPNADHSHFVSAAADPVSGADSPTMHVANINDKIMAEVASYNSDDKVLATDGYTVSPNTMSLTGQINDAYQLYWGHGGFKADPDGALRAMKDLAENAGTVKARAIAQEFVDQWTGKHPMDVSPVQVVEQRMAEAAAKKSSEVAGDVVAQKAATAQDAFSQMKLENAPALEEEGLQLKKELAVQAALKESQAEEIARNLAADDQLIANRNVEIQEEGVRGFKQRLHEWTRAAFGLVEPEVKPTGKLVMDCQMDVPLFIDPATQNVHVDQTCGMDSDQIGTGNYVSINGVPFVNSGEPQGVVEFAGPKWQWAAGKMVEYAKQQFGQAMSLAPR